MSTKTKTKTKSVTKTNELAGRGVLDELTEATAAKVDAVLSAKPAVRRKPATLTGRKVFATGRGVCLDVAAGRTQAGVHIEDEGPRMELYLTRHDADVGVRLRTRFDAELAASLLADPHVGLLTNHGDFGDVPADETPLDEDPATAID